jgi:hypothetical protein
MLTEHQISVMFGYKKLCKEFYNFKIFVTLVLYCQDVVEVSKRNCVLLRQLKFYEFQLSQISKQGFK